MADLSVTPVSTGIKPQQQMSLGDLMNIASSAQAYQQAQQLNPLAVQKATADVQSAQQTAQGGAVDLQQKQTGFKEAQAIKEAIASNPDQFMTNGKFDTAKLNKVIPQIAPLTAAEQIDRYTKVANSQALADSAKLGLTKDQKSIFGSTISALGYAGVDDPAKYSEAIQNIIKAHGNDKDMVDLGTAYTKILGLSDPGAHISNAAVQLGQSLMSQSEQASALRPTARLTPTGQVETTTPSVGGKQPEVTLSQAQGQNPNLGVQEINGVKYNVTTAKDGSLVLKPINLAGGGGGGASAGAGTTAARAGTQAAPSQPKLINEDMPVNTSGPLQLNKQQQDRYDAGKAMLDSATKASQNASESQQNIRTVRQNINAAAGSVPGQTIRNIKQWFAGDPQTEVLTKNLIEQGIRSAESMGLKTDQGRADAEAINGSKNISREGLSQILDRAEAANAAAKAYAKGLAAYENNHPTNGLIHANKFQQAWADNYDPIIFKALNLVNSGKPKTEIELERSRLLSGLSPERRKEFGSKAANLELLMQGKGY